MIENISVWAFSGIVVLVLTACGGGSSGESNGTSKTYGDYITITGPRGAGHQERYSTRKFWVEPSGNAEVPDSIDCSSGDSYIPMPDKYRVTVTNTANDYQIEAVGGIVCQWGIARLIWSIYYPVPLEVGKNRLIARVSYPPEGIRGQTQQIVTRNATSGPIIRHTLPESTNSWPVVSAYTDTTVYAVFDSEIDPDSIDTDTFVVRDQNSVPVTGEIVVENHEVEYLVFGSPVPHPDWTYSKVIFTPDFLLPPLADIAVTISGTIKDTAGREMGKDYDWSFRTWPTPAPTT